MRVGRIGSMSCIVRIIRECSVNVVVKLFDVQQNNTAEDGLE